MASGKSAEYKLAIKIAGKIESSFNSALGAASKSLSALGGAAAKAAQIGAAAITAATTAALAFAKSSIDVGMEFDKSMSQVAATMGTTVDQIGNLRQFAMDMGASTAFSAQQAADGLNILAMAGLSADEQMAALPDVLNLAAAGALTLEQAASYTAGAVKGFSDSMDNAQYYTDLIAKGATLANTDVSGLGEALGRSAATAKTYGQTADSVTLSLLRLADQNVTGEAASTALNRAMSDLYTPTAAASKALKELGVSAYTSTGEARDFNEVVADLKGALSGMTDEQANAYAASIFTTQGLNAFNKMTAASAETMEKFTKGLEDASGSAAEQAATQLDNLAGSITLFQSAWESAQIVVSDQLKPMLNDFVKFGTQAVSDLTEAFKSGGLDAAMETLGGVLSEGLNMVIAQLPGAINAGMQLLGALGKGLLDNLPTITSAMVEIGTMFIDGITQAAPALLQGGVQLISQLATGIASAVPTLASGAVELIREISNTITNNAPLLADGLVSAIPEFVSIAGELLGALGEAILQNLPVLAGAAVSIMTGLGDYLRENLPTIIASGLEFITAFTGSLRENAGLMIDGAISLALSLAQGLANSLPAIIENVPQIVSNIANIINDNAPKLITAALNLIVTLGKGLIQAIPTLIANIPSIIGAIVDTLMAFNWLNLGSSILKGLGNGMKAAGSFLKDIGKQVLDAIKGGFQGLPAAMRGIGQNLIQGLWAGIQALGGWIKSKIGSILKGILSAVKSFFGINSPSTVFADIGKNLILGLFEGIQAIWNIIVDFFAGAVDGLLSFFSGLWTNIQALWGTVATWFQTNVISPLVNFFAPIVETVGGFFSGLWSGIQSVWSAVSSWFDSNVIQPTVNFFSGIVGTVSGFFSSLWSAIQGIWTAAASWFDSTVIQPLVGFFAPIVETVGGFFSSLWDNISGIWQAAGSWFNDNVATPINNAFQSVGDFVTGVFNGLSSVIEGVVNKVGGFINGIADGISNVAGKVGSFLGISNGTPKKTNTNVSIPKLADGGIATGPVLAEIGEGGEPEVVLPLSKLAVLMDGFTGDTAPAVNPKALANAPQLRQLQTMASGGIASPLLAQIGEADAPETIQPLTGLAGILQGMVGNATTNTWNIPALAEGGIAAAPTIAQVGEAGAEAIIPLSDLWSNMQSLMAEAVGSTGGTFSSIAEQMDAADDGAGTSSISDLLGQLERDNGFQSDGGGQPIHVTYSPTNHYHFDGGTPDREEISAAEEMSMEKFERLMRQYEREHSRTSLRG